MDCRCDGSGKIQKGYGQDAHGQFEIKYDYCTCPPSEEARIKDSLVAANLHRFQYEGFIEALKLPKRFRNITLESHPNQSAVSMVSDWHPNDIHCGLFLMGNYGTGKTGLAVGLLKKLIEAQPQAGLFVTAPDLLDQIRQTYNHESVALMDPLERAKRVPILLVDDLGVEKPSPWVQEKFYTLINHRHGEEMTTIFTSNLSLEQVAEQLGERTSWRLVEMCRVVLVKGQNLRAVAS